MAATTFVGLQTFLRIVPVISSTCSLWFAWDQHELLAHFTRPEIRGLSNQILPAWFGAFFSAGAPRVVGLLAATVLSSGAVLRYSPDGLLRDRGSSRWYLASIAFALGHQLFVPFIIWPIRAIPRDAKDKNVAELQAWLRVHTVRTLTVDIAAWVCCVVAAVKTLS